MTALQEISSNKCFGGNQKVFRCNSKELSGDTTFGVFLPPQAASSKCPVLYFLSGDCNIPGEEDAYDFGSGAGFYVDATQAPWKERYRMYSFVTQELPQLVAANFPVSGKQAISGHSMGGHGALVVAFRNPGKYVSASAFAPICNPVNCAWGQKAFSGYLGSDNKADWENYDASVLAKKYSGGKIDILIDQGEQDSFLKEQLEPEALSAAAKGNDSISVQLRMQPGYDHSYFFISTFIGDHFEHHAKYLK